MDQREGRVFEKRSVSFRPDQIEAVRRIAFDVDKHQNFSRVVQEAVDRELARRQAEAERRAA